MPTIAELWREWDRHPSWDRKALAEGWLLNCEHGYIERDDDAAIFIDDDSAVAHVRALAAGSAMHAAALAINDHPGDPEEAA